MHLCNFGKNFDVCESTGGRVSDCIGPGGSNFSAPMIFANYDTWATRIFVKESLLKVFPNKTADINHQVLPGEYGVESPLCRLLCLFIFVMQIVDDLVESLRLIMMLIQVPTAAEPWINYDPPRWTKERQKAKSLLGKTELDLVIFSVRGMPAHWKIVNLVFVIVPKFFIWFLLATSGGIFLMETAAIQDVILNSVAMSFVLQVDEMLAARLCTHATKTVMSRLQPFLCFDYQEENMSDEAALNIYESTQQQQTAFNAKLMVLVVPKRLIFIILITTVVYIGYFWRFCIRTADGSLISEPIYAPKDLEKIGTFPVRWMFAPSTVERHSPATWTMPGRQEDQPFWHIR
jgi:hypothetical protein